MVAASMSAPRSSRRCRDVCARRKRDIVLSLRARMLRTRFSAALDRPFDDGRPPSEARRCALSIPPEHHTMSRERAGRAASVIVGTVSVALSRDIVESTANDQEFKGVAFVKKHDSKNALHC